MGYNTQLVLACAISSQQFRGCLLYYSIMGRPKKSNWLAWVLGTCVLAVVIFAGWFVYRIYDVFRSAYNDAPNHKYYSERSLESARSLLTEEEAKIAEKLVDHFTQNELMAFLRAENGNAETTVDLDLKLVEVIERHDAEYDSIVEDIERTICRGEEIVDNARVCGLSPDYQNTIVKLSRDFSDEDFYLYLLLKNSNADYRLEMLILLEDLHDRHHGEFKDIARDLEKSLRSERKLEIRPAEVTRGKPFNWQVLYEYETESRYLVNLLRGNFSGDEDDELILHLRKPNRSMLLELEGSQRRLNWLEEKNLDLPSFGRQACWDFDGDGLHEIIIKHKWPDGEDFHNSHRLISVADLDGTLTPLYTGPWFNAAPCIGDFDGNKSKDLMLFGWLFPTDAGLNLETIVKFYQPGGEELFNVQFSNSAVQFFAGDIDGDGIDELLNIPMNAPSKDYDYQVSRRGSKMQPFYLPVEIDPWLYEQHMMWLADLDDDGADEIVVDNRILNIRNGTGIELESPPGARYFENVNGHYEGTHAFDMDGSVCIAGVINETQPRSDSFGIWNQKGELIYHEYIGEELLRLQVVNYRGRQRLALLTQTRLLISP